MTAKQKMLHEKKRRSNCKQKRLFTTEMMAKAVGAHEVEKYGTEMMNVYKCDFCEGFHLTKTTNYAPNSTVRVFDF